MSKRLYKVIFISTFLVSVLSSCIVNDEEELTNIEYTVTSSGTQADIQSQKQRKGVRATAVPLKKLKKPDFKSFAKM